MSTFWQDLRYGVRMLLKKPAFTVIAVLTLAIGIGANTAIFSVFNAVILRPLPFSEPDRLVWVWGNIRGGGNRASVAPLDYLDYRAQNSTFEQFAATFPAFTNLTGAGEPERLVSRIVTGNFFQTMGVNALLGRTLQPENEKTGNDQVVVLSHGLWQRRFASDPAIIGKTLALDGKKYDVIGVMPPEFRFPQGTELWGPMNFEISGEMKQRRAHFLRPIGRLKPGVTLAQAQADMDIVANRMAEQYPETNTGWSLRMVPLREQLLGNIRPTLRILLGAVALVLLIACANVANLLLVRSSARQKEVAVRLALGAGRSRIVRQMLTESLLLALVGGTVGVLLAAWGVELIGALSGNNIPSTAQIGIDPVVLGFTLGISILTGFLFGLAPAWQATQLHFNETLKEGGKGAGQHSPRQRTRNLLIVFETAIAVVLLIGAGLLIRSFAQLMNVSPGFDPENVLTMRIDLPRERYSSPEKRGLFWSQLQERLTGLPGVQAVGMNTELPLSGQPNDVPFTVEGRPPVAVNEMFGADFRRVNEDYLRAMRIPVLRGRGLTRDEVRQNAQVVVISESLAAGVFPNEEPLGKRLLFGKTPFEIVGVVGDIRHRSLDSNPYATNYVPTNTAGFANLAIRVSDDPLSLTTAVRRELQAIDRDLPISAVRTMEGVVSESVAAPRFRTWLLGLFALAALLLSAIGMYGVISYTVLNRTHEIGVRMALGAQTRDVLKLIVGQGLKLVLIGVAIGLVAAFGLTRLMRTLLFGVEPADPITFSVIAVLLTAVALLASWVPARRATRTDPITALRCE